MRKARKPKGIHVKDCSWPIQPRKPKTQIEKIKSPYQEEKPPMCYPGTPLSPETLESSTALLAKQINNIGSHTHIKIDASGKLKFKPGEGGFETVQKIEAQAIWMMASVLGGTPQNSDGYFCGGGTESNLMGLWVGREWLRKHPDPFNKGIAILTTPLVHYSIVKAVEMLDIGHHHTRICNRCNHNHHFMPDTNGNGVNYVGMNGAGEMDMPSLNKRIRQKVKEGFRRFIVVATVGTTTMGSIDPVEKIADIMETHRRQLGINFYIHVDASFAGFTVPFVRPTLNFGFEIPGVRSITVDGDKMGQLPYPAGIFLCRKDLMSLVGRDVNYVRGHNDSTFSGSRTCLAPVLAYHQFQNQGQIGQRQYVQSCLDLRDYFIRLLQEKASHFVKILPFSKWVNFAPIEINFPAFSNFHGTNSGIPTFITDEDGDKDDLPTKLRSLNQELKDYHLRSDFFPEDPQDTHSCPRIVYKICIMPHHTTKNLGVFVDDLVKCYDQWVLATQSK